MHRKFAITLVSLVALGAVLLTSGCASTGDPVADAAQNERLRAFGAAALGAAAKVSADNARMYHERSIAPPLPCYGCASPQPSTIVCETLRTNPPQTVCRSQP